MLRPSLLQKNQPIDQHSWGIFDHDIRKTRYINGIF